MKWTIQSDTQEAGADVAECHSKFQAGQSDIIRVVPQSAAVFASEY